MRWDDDSFARIYTNAFTLIDKHDFKRPNSFDIDNLISDYTIIDHRNQFFQKLFYKCHFFACLFRQQQGYVVG